MDEVRQFYAQARAQPSDDDEQVVMIVNVARRVGDATVCDEPNGRIYWLPMLEEEREEACARYLARYGRELIAGLRRGAVVVVSCQEGVHRSAEFAKQLNVACLQAATADSNSHDVICGRFPAQRICGCTIPCRVAMKEVRISQIREKLYIGPVQAAYQDEAMIARGIRAVINASGSDYTLRSGVEYLSIELEDEPSASLESAIRQALPFISKQTAAGDGVLVHCQAGKSRSASLCAAWLMRSENLSAEEALRAVETAHSRADPNPGFRAQLLALDAAGPDHWFRTLCSRPLAARAAASSGPQAGAGVGAGGGFGGSDGGFGGSVAGNGFGVGDSGGSGGSCRGARRRWRRWWRRIDRQGCGCVSQCAFSSSGRHGRG